MMLKMMGMLVASSVSAVEISQCTWAAGKMQVSWTPPRHEHSDYYEVQIANVAGGSTFAVFSTANTSADLDFLTAGRSFWLRVRAHKAAMPSLGPGTWLRTGSEVECKTGADLAERDDTSSKSSKNMFLEVMRQSEFTYDVDYLMNHNSGDLLGDTAFIDLSTRAPDKPSFLNVTFRKSVFTLYCLEVLAANVPDTVTTDGDSRFADYVSCDDNNNATAPLCGCDNFIDRSLSKKEDQLKYCSDSSGKPCKSGYGHNCICNCTKTSLAFSAEYTGMMPFYGFQTELIGHWYSHPKDAECSENEEVGTARADGTKCTWKRHPQARVVRGGDALDFGWNATTGGHQSIDVAQIRQNAALLRQLFDSQPYQQWSCNTAAQETISAVIV